MALSLCWAVDTDCLLRFPLGLFTGVPTRCIFMRLVLFTHDNWFPRISVHRGLDGQYGASYDLASGVP